MNDVSCPQCRVEGLDIHAYESMIVVTADHALFTLRCPNCGARISSARPIPDDMMDEVRSAAVQVGAGMGRNC